MSHMRRVKLLQHAHEPQVFVELAETQPIKSTLNTQGMFSERFTISAEPTETILAPALKPMWKNGKMGMGQ